MFDWMEQISNNFDLSEFTSIFLSIFFEAAPFLLLGTIASGLVEVFVRREDMLKLIPKNPILGGLMGATMGFVFPVCECGVVPLTQRLFHKGLPTIAGITFLLAAPIINPITMASTYTAYGFSDIFFGRVLLGLLVPFSIGMLFTFNRQSILRHDPESKVQPQENLNLVQLPTQTTPQKIQQALRIASEEFFEMGKYLVIGAMLAALMRTVIAQETLNEYGQDPVTSVIAMQIFAFVISVCSTVDAVISLAYVNFFTKGSIIVFLVFGPMVDIKSTLMFLNVFKSRYVVYLVVLPLLLTAIIGIALNVIGG